MLAELNALVQGHAPQLLAQPGCGTVTAAIIIALSRIKTDPETRAYFARKQAERKTKLEALRCLKRHLARRIWRLLYTTQPPAAPLRVTRSPKQANTDIHLT
jgi:hypothetical protein